MTLRQSVGACIDACKIALGGKLTRGVQLPALAYGRRWSGLLRSYYHAPDHPAKLRLITLLERVTGNRRIVAPTKWGFLMALDRSDFVQRTIFAEGEYEPEVTRQLMCELRADDVFY